MDRLTYKCRRGGYTATLNTQASPWQRSEFAWLGIITHRDGWSFGWAWHLDGRSIDDADDAFDLIDFPNLRCRRQRASALAVRSCDADSP